MVRYRFRATRLVAAGVAAGAASTGLGLAGMDAAPAVAALCVTLMAYGAGSLHLSDRMHQALRNRPWQAVAAVSVPLRLHSATVVLARRTDRDVEYWPMQVRATGHRAGLAAPGPDGVLWFCGQPDRGGVVSLPGGDELVWVSPVVDGPARRAAVRAAVARGLAERPAPEQPEGWGGGWIASHRGRRRGLRTARGSAPGGAEAVAVAHRSRPPGLYRWLAVMGCGLFLYALGRESVEPTDLEAGLGMSGIGLVLGSLFWGTAKHLRREIRRVGNRGGTNPVER